MPELRAPPCLVPSLVLGVPHHGSDQNASRRRAWLRPADCQKRPRVCDSTVATCAAFHAEESRQAPAQCVESLCASGEWACRAADAAGLRHIADKSLGMLGQTRHLDLE